MSQADQTPDDDDVPPEYDMSALRGGVRGKQLASYQAGTNSRCWRLKCEPRFQQTRQLIKRCGR